jgi:hypothetical protein
LVCAGTDEANTALAPSMVNGTATSAAAAAIRRVVRTYFSASMVKKALCGLLTIYP